MPNRPHLPGDRVVHWPAVEVWARDKCRRAFLWGWFLGSLEALGIFFVIYYLWLHH